MINQAIILAGGKGTRLGKLTTSIPKPMLKIKGNFFLDYIIEYLFQNNISEVIIIAGHFGEIIYKQYNNKIYKGKIKIRVIIEKEPLGTGGFMIEFKKMLNKKFFLLNGDTIFNINLNILTRELDKYEGVLALKYTENNKRYGDILINTKNEIVDFAEKNNSNNNNLINGGIYLIRKSMIKYILKIPISIEKDIFPILVSKNLLKGIIFNDFFIDIGIKQDFNLAKNLVPKNIIL